MTTNSPTVARRHGFRTCNAFFSKLILGRDCGLHARKDRRPPCQGSLTGRSSSPVKQSVMVRCLLVPRIEVSMGVGPGYFSAFVALSG